MKKLILFLLPVIAISCNNGAKDSATAAVTPAPDATTPMSYPYTIEHPDNWDVGSSANTMTALSALKAWEEGKMDESIKYFADSVHVQFDAFDKKIPRDSLKAMLTSFWNSYKSIQVKMDDWESVISKDKNDEWVTLWYKQYWVTEKGEKDSSEIINDIKLKNGKIIRLDEYTRKTH